MLCSTEPWKCKVSLRIRYNKLGQPLGAPQYRQFGEIIYDQGQVAERIRLAQHAIMNPAIEPEHILNTRSPLHTPDELSFSRNAVVLQISGPDVVELSFTDLPGKTIFSTALVPPLLTSEQDISRIHRTATVNWSGTSRRLTFPKTNVSS